MASYLKKGDSGDSVKELQTLLNQNGANLKVDGIYGKGTQSAVINYQKSQGLTADGIAGTNTMGALKGANTGSTAQKTSTPNYATYTPSAGVAAAKNAVEQYEQNKPTAYQSGYQEQIDSILEGIMNGKKFSYDFNADPIYQQYKDRYVQQGKQAMEDTTARAAALSGGYANSYAATAGNQAYQQYLQGLNDIIPELYDRAYNKYSDEKQDSYNRLSLLQSLDDSAYGKYRDNVDDYNTWLSYLYGKYSDLDSTERSQFDADRTYNFNKEQAAQSQANWEKEYALSKASKGSGDSGRPKNSEYKSVENRVKSLDDYDEIERIIDSSLSAGMITDTEAGRLMILYGSPQDNSTPNNSKTPLGLALDFARRVYPKTKK